MTKVLVVDYGIVNVKNIVRGLSHVGASVEVSVDPKKIDKAERLVLPGVGAFRRGMEELKRHYLVDALLNFSNTGRPLLGICLGMQMLFDKSEEHGEHRGLGLISGRVVEIPSLVGDRVRRKIPHIGWNTVCRPPEVSWDESCLVRAGNGESFYFCHSFMAMPDDRNQILGNCDYEELQIVAAVRKENIIGLQFHPERSAASGLSVLSDFTRSL